MRIRCPQCKFIQEGSNFCANCGIKFEVIPQKTSNTGIIAVTAIGIVIGMCAICGILGNLSKPPETPKKEVVNTTTPTPAPVPPSFAELKQKTNELLKFERTEYKKDDLKQFDDVLQPLRAIPKESKDYKEAQSLIKKLIDKTAPIAAEIVVLGEKPTEFELKLAFNDYLRDKLNDYDSSEYVDYTPAVKEYVKKEPFWTSVLRLRAKNGFGAYILKDVKFYIRNKKAILADGL